MSRAMGKTMDTDTNTSVAAGAGKGVLPAGCGDGASGPPVLVTGALGFDPGTYQRRDTWNAHSNAELRDYLERVPSDAELVTWTLSIDERPVYAIRPGGPFSRKMYEKLRGLLLDPPFNGVVTVAGQIAGTATLLNGEVVPVINLDPTWLSPEPDWLSPARALLSATGSRLCEFEPDLPLRDRSSWNLTQGRSGPRVLDWIAWDGTAKDRKRWLASFREDFKLRVEETSIPGELGKADPPMLDVTWEDGETTLRGSTSEGGALSRLEIFAPADTTDRVLSIYVAVGASAHARAEVRASVGRGDDDRLTLAPTVIEFVPSAEDGGRTYTQRLVRIKFRGRVSALLAARDMLEVSVVSNHVGLMRVFAIALEGDPASPERVERPAPLQRFVDRLRAAQRSLGLSPPERAANFALAHAASQGGPLQAMYMRGMTLDDIGVQRNERCRPRSDCWDVRLVFFNPERVHGARVVHRVTVDVSQVRPVLIGRVQSWNECSSER
ncbi:hypothetical protein NR798_34910 [Archangium gephyra]|uniref:cyanobactin maturation protease PatG family protein n=1 Tax=Archangium gephyra TaxID=48 RepID=UPI0035D51E0F